MPPWPAWASRPTGKASARAGRGAPRVLIVGSGIAGLGCAYRLWAKYGIKAEIYEYNTVPGGRISTLRGYFADGQVVERHAEFINPEHTETLALAKKFGLPLDNTDKYPPGTHPGRETMRFHGKKWPQAALNRDWHEWGWKLFHDAAVHDRALAPALQLEQSGGRRFDHMSVSEWIERYIPAASGRFRRGVHRGRARRVRRPGRRASALNLVYLLGQDDSTASGAQPHGEPELDGADEKWHIHGGNDQLITGILDRLPPGVLHLGQRLVAVRPRAGGGYRCSFECAGATRDVTADHVVLALPFTLLRSVDLSRVAIAPRHRKAINEEPLGSNSKMFLQFSSRVWNAEQMTGNCYYDGVVQGGWDATDYQPGPAGILAALPGGRSALDWGRRYGLASHSGAPPDSMTRAFLRGFDHLFPHVSRAFNGRAYYVWSPGDPHILGAYSYLAVGQFTAFNGIQGRREGNLHFAGEQTSVDYQGYIEGGLRSGYRCATEVAAR